MLDTADIEFYLGPESAVGAALDDIDAAHAQGWLGAEEFEEAVNDDLHVVVQHDLDDSAHGLEREVRETLARRYGI